MIGNLYYASIEPYVSNVPQNHNLKCVTFAFQAKRRQTENKAEDDNNNLKYFLDLNVLNFHFR